jgi:hypothetical protein
MTTQISAYPRIIIQPDWSMNLRANTLPVDVWLEYKAGSSDISRLTANVHGVCSIKAAAAAESEAKVYKTLSGDKFQSGDIDAKQQQLRIKLHDTDFSHTFQGRKGSPLFRISTVRSIKVQSHHSQRTAHTRARLARVR